MAFTIEELLDKMRIIDSPTQGKRNIDCSEIKLNGFPVIRLNVPVVFYEGDLIEFNKSKFVVSKNDLA